MKFCALLALGTVSIFTFLPFTSSLAGPFTDDLAKCLVSSTSSADRTLLVKWFFAAVSSHPDVKSIAPISEAQRDELTKNAAKLFEKLLTESCRTKARQAIKFEGQTALEMSFQVLGRVAGRELTADPNVAENMAASKKYLDEKKLLKQLFESEQ